MGDRLGLLPRFGQRSTAYLDVSLLANVSVAAAVEARENLKKPEIFPILSGLGHVFRRPKFNMVQHAGPFI